jgi:ATP-dependent DNA ligase
LCRTCATRFYLVKKLIIDDCPFVNLPEKKASRWDETLIAEKIKECRSVEPVLVCQVTFVEWTDGDKLRHCTFVGMRDEKAAAKVVREA